jgi:hypothetical protein
LEKYFEDWWKNVRRKEFSFSKFFLSNDETQLTNIKEEEAEVMIRKDFISIEAEKFGRFFKELSTLPYKSKAKKDRETQNRLPSDDSDEMVLGCCSVCGAQNVYVRHGVCAKCEQEMKTFH